jgi:ethanolamine-phosphate cytidylyltransferase
MLLCTRNHLIPIQSSTFTDPKILEMLTQYASLPSGAVPVIYVDGTFDLFTPGHVELLRLIYESSESPYVVVGLHDDYTINKIKGYNYPIMNILERTLVVLQCKYISALVISAPYTPSKTYLTKFLGPLSPSEVWHGPTKVIEVEGEGDPYAEVKEMGILKTITSHKWDDISARKIVDRILNRRLEFEERQRKKGVKAGLEREMKLMEESIEDNPWADNAS